MPLEQQVYADLPPDPATADELVSATESAAAVAVRPDRARAVLGQLAPHLQTLAAAADLGTLARLVGAVAQLVNRLPSEERQPTASGFLSHVRKLAAEALAGGRPRVAAALLQGCGAGRDALLLSVVNEVVAGGKRKVAVPSATDEARGLVELLVRGLECKDRTPGADARREAILVPLFEAACAAGIASEAWARVGGKYVKPHLAGAWDAATEQLARHLRGCLTPDTCPDAAVWLGLRIHQHVYKAKRADVLGRLAEAAYGTACWDGLFAAYRDALGGEATRQRSVIRWELANSGAVHVLSEELLPEVLPWKEKDGPQTLKRWLDELVAGPQFFNSLCEKIASLRSVRDARYDVNPLAEYLLKQRACLGVTTGRDAVVLIRLHEAVDRGKPEDIVSTVAALLRGRDAATCALTVMAFASNVLEAPEDPQRDWPLMVAGLLLEVGKEARRLFMERLDRLSRRPAAAADDTERRLREGAGLPPRGQLNTTCESKPYQRLSRPRGGWLAGFLSRVLSFTLFPLLRSAHALRSSRVPARCPYDNCGRINQSVYLRRGAPHEGPRPEFFVIFSDTSARGPRGPVDLPPMDSLGRDKPSRRCCWYCGRSLLFESLGRLPERHLAIVGGPGTGKTLFLCQATRQLRDRLGSLPGNQVQVDSDEQERELQADLVMLYRGRVPPAPRGDVRPAFGLAVRVAAPREFRGLVYLFDVPGRDCLTVERFGRKRLEDLEGVVLMVDPFALPGLAGHAGRLGAWVNASPAALGDVVSVLVNGLTGTLGLRPGEKCRTPLAVVLGKADALPVQEFPFLAGLCPGEGNAPGPELSARCREALVRLGAEMNLRALEGRFATVNYFACSALGRAPDPGDARPFRPAGVAAPLLWLLGLA